MSDVDGVQGLSGPASGVDGLTGAASAADDLSGPASAAEGLTGPPTGAGGLGAPGAPAGAGAVTRPNPRKVREGVVVSSAMDKTAVVAVIERVRHRRYTKTVQRTKRIHAHDEANETKVGDRVRISETRPLSKLKHWRIVEVLERAK